AGADDTRPNTDFSLHPFPSAQTHTTAARTHSVCASLDIFPAAVSHSSESWLIVQELSPKQTSSFKTVYIETYDFRDAKNTHKNGICNIFGE
ncbi:hypothetical protein PO909_023223, partial [Leuciscus waleckii]